MRDHRRVPRASTKHKTQAAFDALRHHDAEKIGRASWCSNGRAGSACMRWSSRRHSFTIHPLAAFSLDAARSSSSTYACSEHRGSEQRASEPAFVFGGLAYNRSSVELDFSRFVFRGDPADGQCKEGLRSRSDMARPAPNMTHEVMLYSRGLPAALSGGRQTAPDPCGEIGYRGGQKIDR